MKLEIDEGIRKDETGHYVFDKKFDEITDIIELCTDTSGKVESDGITCYYGYEFNTNVDNKTIKEFRDNLKHCLDNNSVFYGDEVFDFVEDGLFSLDKYKKLQDFGVLITVKSTHSGKSLFDMMEYVMSEYNGKDFITLQLIKRLCNDVLFDKDKARQALRNSQEYKNKSDKKIDFLLNMIEQRFNEEKRKGNVFKIKKYVPVVARVGFSNFVTFKSKEDEQVYKELEKGTDVLICDDFITSGSTVKEIKKYLDIINPNNNVYIFALIKQRALH